MSPRAVHFNGGRNNPPPTSKNEIIKSQLLREFWSELYNQIALEPAPAAGARPSVVPAGVISELANTGAPTLQSPGSRTLADEVWVTSAYDHPDALVLRFLRARKWDVKAAINMYLTSVKWRMEFGVNEVIREGEKGLDMAELTCGKSYYQGRDKQGRPCWCVVVFKSAPTGSF